MNASLRRPRPLAPQRKRRRLVLMALGGYALAIAAYLVYQLVRGSEWPFVIVSLLGMVVMAFGGIQLMKPARLGLPEGRDRYMDERQWQKLSQAHMTAYRILGAIFILVSLYFYLGHKNGHLPLPSSSYDWVIIWIGTVVFIPALPTMILAWTEPDFQD